MSGFLVDTNVVSEFARTSPNESVVRWLEQTNPVRLYVSVITLGEIRLGIENLARGARRSQLERWLSFEVPGWFRQNLLSVTPSIAERWAYVTAMERSRGRVLSMADGMIAATALEQGLTVVTRNVKDFETLGVPLLDPWAGIPGV